MQPISEIAEKVKPGTKGWLVTQKQRRNYIERVTLDMLDASHPIMVDAVAMCHRWAERKREGYLDASLVFVGPVGTGKTHLARSVLWSIFNSEDDGTPVSPVGRFYSANDMIQAIDPGLFLATFIPQYCPVLVIDDIGSEQQIPFIGKDGQLDEVSRRYFQVINYCYTWQISVVITSNLSLTRLQEHLGRRCWSRLNEMAPAGFMIDLTGAPDWRMLQSGRTV